MKAFFVELNRIEDCCISLKRILNLEPNHCLRDCIADQLALTETMFIKLFHDMRRLQHLIKSVDGVLNEYH